MERESGFYWVRDKVYGKDEYFVAECVANNRWYVTGNERQFSETDFDAIGPRVYEPSPESFKTTKP